MRRNIGITVSAIVLAIQLGSPLAAAVPTTEQLGQISAFLAENNVRALRAFLLEHPELLVEATPLAALLREFMQQSTNLNDFLGFEPDMRNALGGNGPHRSFGDGPGSGNDPSAVLY